MILDWLAREGWIILVWWLLATAAGLTVLPLTVRLLRGLPDGGYTLARPAGLLLVAYVHWLLAVLGFTQNTSGGILLAWLVVLVASLAIYWQASPVARAAFSWRGWWRENRVPVIAGELLFAGLLFGYALFRAYQNDLVTTEKPMDLAFMSAIQHSTSFPPNDPWLSGYAISYYYFGYLIAGMMSLLAGVQSTIGYSMHLALMFALAGSTAFGLGYNLLRSRALARVRSASEAGTADAPRGPTRRAAVTVGLLAAAFLVLMGNYQLPLVEIPYQTGSASESYLRFWDVNARREPRLEAADSLERWDYWWWFRGARVISDRAVDGGHIEVIAEFPQFSFVLADSHPHVMALPFAVLAMGLALNLLLLGRRPRSPEIVLYGLVVGGLIFLNTWDSPIYIALLVGADALRRLTRYGRLAWRDWGELLVFGLLLLGVAVLAYLPFLVGFRSQLGGVLPNLINPTYAPQFILKFGPFILLLGLFLAVEAWRASREGAINWRLGLRVTGGLLLALVLGALLFTVLTWISPAARSAALSYVQANGGWGEVLPVVLERRLVSIFVPVTLLAAVLLVVARLFPPLLERPAPGEDDAPVGPVGYPLATGFALLLVGAGVSLVLFPEFLFLRDNFNTRMNTVFKFTYQAWAMFSIAAAYGVYTVLADSRLARPPTPVRALLGAIMVLAVGLGSLNPVLSVYTRAMIETGRSGGRIAEPLTMDGGPRFTALDDYNVIMCLSEIVGRADVVVAEANPQGNRVNYNPNHGRVGSLTGMPVVIGWPGHQSQWRGRGFSAAIGSRQPDLDRLYSDSRFEVAQDVIDRYGIDYILYGQTERQHYGSSGEEKFADNFEIVCESGTSRMYRVTPTLAARLAGG